MCDLFERNRLRLVQQRLRVFRYSDTCSLYVAERSIMADERSIRNVIRSMANRECSIMTFIRSILPFIRSQTLEHHTKKRLTQCQALHFLLI